MACFDFLSCSGGFYEPLKILEFALCFHGGGHKVCVLFMWFGWGVLLDSIAKLFQVPTTWEEYLFNAEDSKQQIPHGIWLNILFLK